MPETVSCARRINSAPKFQTLTVYVHSRTISHQSNLNFFMLSESEGSGIFSVESCTAFSLEKQTWLSFEWESGELLDQQSGKVGFLIQINLTVSKATEKL